MATPAAVLAASLALLACARQLPDYAKPRAEVVEPGKLATSDGIAYRTLTRADFRAKKPPIADASHAEQMGAYTCTNVFARKEARVEANRDPANGRFTAHTALVFVARMDRNCSWWNPQQEKGSVAYLLQHEQIHFAIAELAARDLTARVARLSATGDTPQQAVDALQRAIDEASRDEAKAMNARNLDFDRDTSGRQDVALQQQWFDRVSAELKR